MKNFATSTCKNCGHRIDAWTGLHGDTPADRLEWVHSASENQRCPMFFATPNGEVIFDA